MKAPRPIRTATTAALAGIQRLCSASIDLSRMAPARPTALPSRGLTLDAQHQWSIVASNPHCLNKWLLRADLLGAWIGIDGYQINRASYLSLGFAVSSARRRTGDDRSVRGAAGGVACVPGTHLNTHFLLQLAASALNNASNVGCGILSDTSRTVRPCSKSYDEARQVKRFAELVARVRGCVIPSTPRSDPVEAWNSAGAAACFAATIGIARHAGLDRHSTRQVTPRSRPAGSPQSCARHTRGTPTLRRMHRESSSCERPAHAVSCEKSMRVKNQTRKNLRALIALQREEVDGSPLLCLNQLRRYLPLLTADMRCGFNRSMQKVGDLILKSDDLFPVSGQFADGTQTAAARSIHGDLSNPSPQSALIAPLALAYQTDGRSSASGRTVAHSPESALASRLPARAAWQP